MSTALAIAATTRVIGALINQTIQLAADPAVLGGGPYVTSRAPDQLELASDEVPQLSLFLYHVTYNQGYMEMGLPTVDSSGNSTCRPPLAIDLHYLLIAYGDSDYVPHMLLGLGMQALHETPFLYRQQITQIFTPPPALNDVDSALAGSGLANQLEMIKITPEPLSTEDLSKLWTSFGGKFRPSVAYEATVVLIDSTEPYQSALPVLSRNISLNQFNEPTITAVTPLYLAWSAGATLTLAGTNLAGPGTVVVFDNNPTEPQTPQTQGPSGATVTTTLPDLPAGINTFRVAQQVSVGAPPPKNVAQSNVSVFYLQPVVRTGPSPGELQVTVGPVDNAVDPPTTPVAVALDPAMNSTQEVQLLLNEVSPPAGQVPLALTFTAEPADIAVNSVSFTTFGTRAGSYLVRVRVDGAESALESGPGGTFSGPTVVL